jgi:hypothetical protein
MRSLNSVIDALPQLLNHLLPIIITIVVIVFAIVVRVGFKYLKNVSLFANASTPHGEMELAKYLAEQTGGPQIDVDKAWIGFLPAAQDIHQLHQEKIENLNTKP